MQASPISWELGMLEHQVDVGGLAERLISA